jgi:hypothetical protein
MVTLYLYIFKSTTISFILKINWFAKNALTNVLILSKDEVYIDQSGNTNLVFKVLNYQDIYRLEHLSSLL